MKRMMLALAFFATGAILFAQVNLPEHRFAAGKWAMLGQRLYQNDEVAGLAKMNIRVPQDNAMVYEFDARYEGGAEDGHGGFGLHIFADSAYNGPSWGAGNSYLLWFNYDEKPASKDIPAGFSAQIYRSYSDTRMELVQSFDLNDYAETVPAEDLDYPAHIKIIANGNTGEVQVYDPIDPTTYYELSLNTKDLPLKGNWVALRTNGMKLSFSN
jgi:hypothetical protein